MMAVEIVQKSGKFRRRKLAVLINRTQKNMQERILKSVVLFVLSLKLPWKTFMNVFEARKLHLAGA